jgi:hypothetical protein
MICLIILGLYLEDELYEASTLDDFKIIIITSLAWPMSLCYFLYYLVNEKYGKRKTDRSER